MVQTAIFAFFAKRVKSGVQEPPETNEPMPSEMAETMPIASEAPVFGSVPGTWPARASQPLLIVSPEAASVAASVGLCSRMNSGLSKKSAWMADQPPRTAIAGTATSEMMCSALMPK